jgi:excisionase family DNA binding protein
VIGETSTENGNERRALSVVSKQPVPAAVASRPRARVHVEVPSRLVSAQQAAALLGIPYTTLRDVAMRGHIPVVRVPECRRWWFDRRDLDRLVDSWKERAGGPL